MSAIVKLGNASRTGSYLGIPGEGQSHVIVSDDLMTIRLKAGNVQVLGGRDDGLVLDDKVVQANQQVVIYTPVVLRPKRYHTLLSVNPRLHLLGLISHPTVLEPGQGEDIFVVLKASKKVDLNELDYIFNLNMVD